MKDNYKTINRRAWGRLVREGNESSRPFGKKALANARNWLDSNAWIPWEDIKVVLCLASGGGQQVPGFASLGLDVTAVDLSPDQIRLDQEVAQKYGYKVEFIQGDMLDLSRLHGRKFDLVYQPISSCYVPDVRRLYREVYRVLKPGGYYWVEHWSPFSMQLDPWTPWDGKAYRISVPQRPGKPVVWDMGGENGNHSRNVLWHYIHPLNELIGGLCDSGFTVLKFAERWHGNQKASPNSYAHMAAYLPPFLAIFAQRKMRF